MIGYMTVGDHGDGSRGLFSNMYHGTVPLDNIILMQKRDTPKSIALIVIFIGIFIVPQFETALSIFFM
jgi:hypothetical protein